MNESWINQYLNLYKKSIFVDGVEKDLIKLKKLFEKVNSMGKKIILMGNGASASIASHVSVDLSKAAGVRAVNFNEANLITCLSNDYGYENFMAEALKLYADPGDVVVLISSSGKSLNVVNAAKKAKKFGIKVVTFTGFEADNPLKNEGDINFWVNSKAYNVIENTHQIWLLAICDAIIGTAEYSANKVS